MNGQVVRSSLRADRPSRSDENGFLARYRVAWLCHGLVTVGVARAEVLDLQDLKASPGSDARKVALVKFLRERTTISEWVARALCMGGAANVGHYVRTRPWQSVRRKVPKAMLRFSDREANDLG